MIHSFEWYQIIPGMKLLPGQVAHALIVACILIVLAVLCNRRIAAKGCDTLPDRRLSPLSFFELVYNGFLGIMRENLGDHARDFVPLIGGLGTFILFSNLIGLIPGFTPPTDNINTTAACAIIVFLATHYYGFKAHGVGLPEAVRRTVLVARLADDPDRDHLPPGPAAVPFPASLRQPDGRPHRLHHVRVNVRRA